METQRPPLLFTTSSGSVSTSEENTPAEPQNRSSVEGVLHEAERTYIRCRCLNVTQREASLRSGVKSCCTAEVISVITERKMFLSLTELFFLITYYYSAYIITAMLCIYSHVNRLYSTKDHIGRPCQCLALLSFL